MKFLGCPNIGDPEVRETFPCYRIFRHRHWTEAGSCNCLGLQPSDERLPH